MVKLLGKAIYFAVGPILDFIGIFGALDDANRLPAEIEILKGVFDNPYVYVGLLLFGTILAVLAYGSWRAEFIITSAGGITKREFPAQFGHWASVQNFPVWQVAWLWNDLEPQDARKHTEGTRAYPMFRRLKEDLDQDKFPGAQRVNGSWVWAPLSRQQLIDYALRCNERPKFLFSRKHFLNFLCAFSPAVYKKIPWSNVEQYKSLGEIRVLVYDHLTNNPENTGQGALQDADMDEQENVELLDLNNVLDIIPKGIDFYHSTEELIRRLIWSGHWEAIGREVIGDYAYEYKQIPAWEWEFITINGSDVGVVNKRYSDIKIKMLTFV